MFKFLVILFSLLAVSHAQVFGYGPCPNIPAVTDFTIANLQGKWYQQYRYPNALENTQKCVIAQFKVTDGTISVTNTALALADSKETKANGTLRMKTNNTADFAFNKESAASLTPANYKIIGTDYSSYFVMYSCRNYFFYHFKYVSIFTRDRFIIFLNNQSITKAKSVLTQYQLDNSNTTLLPVDQFNCPLFW